MLAPYVARASCVLILVALPLSWTHADRLVFGSFRSAENAANWAQKLAATLGVAVESDAYPQNNVTWHRVQSSDLTQSEFENLSRRARTADLEYWRLRGDSRQIEPVANATRNEGARGVPRLQPPARVSQPAANDLALPESGSRDTEQPASSPSSRPASTPESTPASTPATIPSVHQQFDIELGLGTRMFAETGLLGQRRLGGSVSLKPEYYAAWANDRKSFTLTPFLRLDSNDSERSHADIRELFFSYVGNSWDVHVGAKQVFWGVTEFHHLVDVINQTDLVENIDGEDKLGQPMVHISTVNDWGILDAYLLTGFRERTFPGTDGRLGLPFKIDGDALYESGAEQLRTDFALRWSHHVGVFEFGVHHFSGTSREPMFEVASVGGTYRLTPYYPVIDQSGVDAQAIVGDWAIKVEGISRSGFGDRYTAANLGVEKTLVGIWGSHADFGLVLEYMYDDRGEDAFNTLFENDVAIGGRLLLNDFANTQALLGLVVDTERDNYALSIEGSRQLTDSWQLAIEGRWFGGGETISSYNSVLTLTDPDFKHAWLDSEDYLQIEFIKYF